ncbi:MAG: ATP-dependent helicase [Candidatus Promineifilaceae bacterium]
MTTDLTNGLNSPQAAAVTAGLGPVLVLAGPGSGKTSVLTRRIAYLVQEIGIAPWKIMAVTFTNKAAKEIRERVERLLGENLRGIMMGTFHSTCARILRRETDALSVFGYQKNFVIFDADDQKRVIKLVLKELNIDDKKFNPRTVLSQISMAKDKLITPELYESADYPSTVIKRAYEQYQRMLVTNNAMDFDDLLLTTVLLFDKVPEVLAKYQERFHYLLVDEFQDTNTVQYSLLMRLAAGRGNVFAVGDADQSIYKWRGADFRNIQKFRDQYSNAQTFLLEQNYRSTQTILDAAKAVILKNPERVHKELFTTRKGGPKIDISESHDEIEEAADIVNRIVTGERDLGDYAIMYRTNAQSRVIEEAFLRANVPYRLIGAQRFYGRREIKDLIAYLRLIHNLRDDISFIRAVNTPTRGIGAKTVQNVRAWGTSVGLQGGESLIMVATDRNIEHPFKGRALNAMTRFGNLLNGWVMVRDQMGVGDLLEKIVEQINFKTYLDDGTDEGRERWENVKEFIGVAKVDPKGKLVDFLEKIALIADADTVDVNANVPTLMTLHASKGLEFPIVFITGCEEKILPHSRSILNTDEMAEERRLFYVGITRAKDKVYLTYTFRRSLYGMSEMATPSRFLMDIPGELVHGGNKLAERRDKAKSQTKSWSWSESSPPSSQSRSAGYSSPGSRGSHGAYGSERGSRHRPTKPKPASRPPAYNRPKPDSRSAKSSKRVLPQSNAARQNARARARARANAAAPVAKKYKSGQKVSHAKFGDGIVVQSKMKGGDEEVTVAFREYGIKRLAASFAKLETHND